jgi:hypothetical protein
MFDNTLLIFRQEATAAPGTGLDTPEPMEIDGPEYKLNHPNDEAPVPMPFLIVESRPVSPEQVPLKEEPLVAAAESS